MNTSPKNSHEAKKEIGGDGKLLSEKTDGVEVEPGEVGDKSEGMKENDYLGKRNVRNRDRS